jgi:tetratricopeptide (TPR) repeat protein
MKARYFPIIAILLSFSGFWSGCTSWQADWPAPGPAPEPAVPASDVGVLLEKADRLAAAADSRERLEAAMAAYTRVLEQQPNHVRALTELANQTILLGTAYTEGRKAKKDRFLTAMRLCERAMYTDPDFRVLADQGAPPWDAAGVLDEEHLPSMMFWSTAVLYYFKEVLTFPEQVVNLEWVEHTGPFLARMEALDPAWGGGAIQFTQSLYYGILPGVLGGDDERSAACLKQAVAFGAPWMLSRWGRAKYFRVRDQDRRGFEEDLRWVLRQAVAAPGEAYCWRAYFHQDAQDALNNIDDFF